MCCWNINASAVAGTACDPDPGSQAVLLVDASNAFNSVNRQAALHNILRICPSLAQILINTYQRPVRLIIPGSGGLMSTEGTTQGDPLAMAMYALAVTPLIHHLHSSDPAVSQVWYADDATGVGKCAALRKWWDTLSQLGPLFGYIPNASKTYLVVKDKYVAAARLAFSGTGIVISADGQRHLGAAIGHRDYTATYVTSKVQAWCNDVKRLAEVADIFPHAVYAALLMGCLVAGLTLCVLSQTLQISCNPWRMLFINLLFQHYLVVLHVHLLRGTCMHSQSAWVVWV